MRLSRHDLVWFKRPRPRPRLLAHNFKPRAKMSVAIAATKRTCHEFHWTFAVTITHQHTHTHRGKRAILFLLISADRRPIRQATHQIGYIRPLATLGRVANRCRASRKNHKHKIELSTKQVNRWLALNVTGASNLFVHLMYMSALRCTRGKANQSPHHDDEIHWKNQFGSERLSSFVRSLYLTTTNSASVLSTADAIV